MAKFRKKPVVIEAVRCQHAVNAFTGKWSDLPAWLVMAYDHGDLVATAHGIHIKTLEGTMLAGLEDWIICGVKGEIYPCKSDIFDATYDVIE